MRINIHKSVTQGINGYLDIDYKKHKKHPDKYAYILTHSNIHTYLHIHTHTQKNTHIYTRTQTYPGYK